jgi:hypothetical protein
LLFQRLNTVLSNVLSVKKLKKILNPPPGSYLFSEPVFSQLKKKAFLHDFVIQKKFTNSKDLFIGHPTHAGSPPTLCIRASKGPFL